MRGLSARQLSARARSTTLSPASRYRGAVVSTRFETIVVGFWLLWWGFGRLSVVVDGLGVRNDVGGAVTGVVVQAGSIQQFWLAGGSVPAEQSLVPRQLPSSVRDFTGRAEYLGRPDQGRPSAAPERTHRCEAHRRSQRPGLRVDRSGWRGRGHLGACGGPSRGRRRDRACFEYRGAVDPSDVARTAVLAERAWTLSERLVAEIGE
jgi:hypothetical protein